MSRLIMIRHAQVRNTAVSEFLFSRARFSLDVFNALPHLPPGELVTHI